MKIYNLKCSNSKVGNVGSYSYKAETYAAVDLQCMLVYCKV